jgi:tRNA uridine 5-carbamoylmethylation protein Kti12
MKIIIVTGAGGTGKTTTIAKDFRKWLVDQKAKEIKGKTDEKGDYEGVFEYKGKTVAVNSSGDNYYLVVFAIARYADKDILVLAGTTNRKSIVDLVKVIRESETHCAIEKKAASDADNKRVLDKIIAAL